MLFDQSPRQRILTVSFLATSVVPLISGRPTLIVLYPKLARDCISFAETLEDVSIITRIRIYHVGYVYHLEVWFCVACRGIISFTTLLVNPNRLKITWDPVSNFKWHHKLTKLLIVSWTKTCLNLTVSTVVLHRRFVIVGSICGINYYRRVRLCWCFIVSVILKTKAKICQILSTTK